MSGPTPAAADRREDFIERILQSAFGAFDIFALYLGDRLGFYDALAEGAATASELAARAGTDERYTREWLEQQAVTGVLEVENPEARADERRFSLPPGHDEVLTNRESLNYLAPLAQLVAGAVHPLEQLLEAYRTGSGIPYVDYGRDLREGQGRMNRNMLLYQFAQEYLPAIPDVHDKLQAGGRVADIGCGVGWSGIGLARAYPAVEVDGFDLDEPSVEQARRNAEEHGVADRARFYHRDAGEADFQEGHYDLVTAIECIHDMGNPVEVLAAMRRLAKPDGAVLVVDERVREAFTPEPGEVEWMMYGWSILHCLPVGLADCNGNSSSCAATGTVMRPPTLQRYAQEAGFSEVEVLPLENDFFWFYRLRL
jgi:ubiquinone/menaquinone biosynthesis C-methylase UbiE